MSRGAELRCYMNLMAMDSLPVTSAGFRNSFDEKLELLAAAGFAGVQFAEPGTSDQLTRCRAAGMGIAGSGRVNAPSEALPLASGAKDAGYECLTIHAGWGLEDDDEAYRLLGSIAEASERCAIPLYVETHRATVCQDMWRTVQWVKKIPALRFNGDFSHWYAGQEMVYGGFESKLAFIQPVIERVRFLHGRIANPGCIQVAVNEGSEQTFVQHFRRLWTDCFREFQQSGEADWICFTPELLAPDIYYARTFAGMEESDRWQQSLLLKAMAEDCFAVASSAA